MKKILVMMRETFPTNEVLTDKNIAERYILNPYDEYALLQAKKIKEEEEKKEKKVEIICCFLSQRESQYGLRTALGLGGDRGIFLSYRNLSIPELARYIAEEIQRVDYDDIFMGIRDVNNDREELPSQLSVALNLALYSHILSVEYKGVYFVRQEKEATINTLEVQQKGIFAFSQNVYEPEYPSIESILLIQQKEIYVAETREKVEEAKKKLHYQTVERAQEVYKKVKHEEATTLLIDYLQKWKLID